MILILLTLIVGATSQANYCLNKTEEKRIRCITNNIHNIIGDKSVQDTLHGIKFDVESSLSKESEKNLLSMINMTDQICVCHMQANAYKHHLQKYLFSGRKHPKLSVNDTVPKLSVSLLINLQIISEIFQEVSKVQLPKSICINIDLYKLSLHRLLHEIELSHVWSLLLTNTKTFISWLYHALTLITIC